MRILFLLAELANKLCFWLDFTGMLLWGASVALLIAGMKKVINDKMKTGFLYSLFAVFIFLFGLFLIMLSKLYQ